MKKGEKWTAVMHEAHKDFRGTPEERFWSRVDKNGPKIVETHCWVWTGAKTDRGYGSFWMGKAAMGAHRFACELKHGPLLKGFHACHRCDNPACVNPDHIFPGSDRDNVRDCVKKGRLPKQARKLTEAKVQEIRERIATGLPLKKIAEEFGVAHRTVSHIKAGTLWKSSA